MTILYILLGLLAGVVCELLVEIATLKRRIKASEDTASKLLELLLVREFNEVEDNFKRIFKLSPSKSKSKK